MSNSENKILPRLIVVAENPRQRLAFGEAVKSCGYDLIDCIPSSRLDSSYLSLSPDLWLIDSANDVDVIEKLTHHDKYLLGFTPAPEITNVKGYAKWQRHLKRKLIHVLGIPDENAVSSTKKVTYDWHYLFVLGASMGGPKAVKAFLDHLPTDLPIALLLAQHNDAKAIRSLPSVLTRNNKWKCDVIDGTVQLCQGKLWIVPPERQIKFAADGMIELDDKPWQDQYKPCISDVMLAASHTTQNRMVSIIFSGMGDDGSNAAQFIIQQGSKVWAQTLDSCECPSQPESVQATGAVEFTGDPAQLAQRVIQHITLYPSVH